MKVIYNRILPIKGFIAINLFGIMFARKEYGEVNKVTINHESIHTAQMRELGYIFFYIIYFFEWLWRLFTSPTPYRSISFEKEAYEHQYDVSYLNKRKHFAMWRK